MHNNTTVIAKLYVPRYTQTMKVNRKHIKRSLKELSVDEDTKLVIISRECKILHIGPPDSNNEINMKVDYFLLLEC